MSASPPFLATGAGLVVDLFAGGGGASTGLEAALGRRVDIAVRFADTYDLSAAKTKSAQVRLIGNSVCPEVAEAVVRANVTPSQSRRAA